MFVRIIDGRIVTASVLHTPFGVFTSAQMSVGDLALVTEAGWNVVDDAAAINATAVAENGIPIEVTARQARLALLKKNLLAKVEALAQQAGEAARLEWEYAGTVKRDSPLLFGIGQALGLSSGELDELFVAASRL